jgi:hypothetical protein
MNETLSRKKTSRNWMKGQTKPEAISYLAIWAILFIAPVLTLYVESKQAMVDSFSWNPVFFVWREYIPFLIIFIIHNYVLAPILIYQHKRALYTGLIAAIIILFAVIQCTSRPDFEKISYGKPMRNEITMRGKIPLGKAPKRMEPKDIGMDDAGPDAMGPDGMGPGDMSKAGPDRKDMGAREHHPPVIFGQHDIVKIIILIMMLGMNLGVKLYIKSIQDRKHIKDMEKRGLEQQLEYLKYQINPHFLMNTLNNIHALVDIDQEKAKSTIVELSKMLRFMLYEGDKRGVPLGREMEFINTYITLMKLRYTDKVKISLSLPELPPDKMIPPLMLITFIENAFKHGVSYQRDTFIGVNIETSENELKFTCRNTKKEAKDEDKHGGVGLKNVKQRLNLIYGDNYTLNINDNTETYNVELTIPI